MKTKKSVNERYSDRTCRIIESDGRIFLKEVHGGTVPKWYVGFMSCIAAGEDGIVWQTRPHAQEFGDLQTAFAVAKIFSRKDVKVVTVYPHKRANKK